MLVRQNRAPFNRARATVVSTATLLGIALAGCSGSFADNNPAAQAAAAGAAPAIQTASPRNVAAALPDFAGLVDHYGPAVVNVAVVGKSQPVSNDMPGMSPNDPLNDFLRRFGQPMPRGNQPPPRGEGSGFIVSADGYILTNAHVVAEAEEVTVKTTDRREYTAKVIGVDEATDVAVLKIDAKNLPTVKIGDPSKLRPGEWVIAIGSPFGFENSVTAGIVSATSRSMPGSNYAPFIQTDVAVNPGNSGGPLFNLQGEVVGINSQIFSRSGGYMGLSFAIPIDVANNVQTQLVSTGKVTRSRIGVSIQDVNAQLAESFGLDRPKGALVGMVEDDGPGAKAGIKAGDVILKVDGTEIDQSSQLPGLIASKKPGTTVNLEVWRDGGVKRLSAKPVEIAEKGVKVANRDSADADETAKLGLVVRPLQKQEKQQVETDGDLVVEDSDGPAAAAGVQRGDIILGVNGKPVKSVEELKTAARKSKGKVVALLIERDSAQIFVPVRTG
ncbi:serine protease [Steroidobacter agaridevorans]|uniref:Probable periplasmic serine endoprotease DegP-like n=1 Tax=Steroidobacter agaridevorans TaxID=2695856 RepID=A0A829Y6W6_9GAMM|nr:DegQ family serine endoprotease [Steroidobacter agaridevorans]GFE78967.1 serine protease [Steroidobacter agaridevorans]GFE88122.1 serine protease [Steroidobacter agaridevorans]